MGCFGAAPGAGEEANEPKASSLVARAACECTAGDAKLLALDVVLGGERMSRPPDLATADDEDGAAFGTEGGRAAGEDV